MSEKQKLLIVDDSELNRDILKEILGSRYDYMKLKMELRRSRFWKCIRRST